MTRDEKIGKLSRAVREWRGVSSIETGKWVQFPKRSAAKRVARWLEELGIDTDEGLQTILAFTTYTDFRAWIRGLG